MKSRPINIILIISGIVLSFVWAFLVGYMDFFINLPCYLSPQACAEGQDLASIIKLGPLVVGSLLLSIGIVYKLKISKIYKTLIVLTASIAIYYTAFFFLIFVGIATHGFGA